MSHDSMPATSSRRNPTIADEDLQGNDSPAFEALEPPKPAQLPTEKLFGFEHAFSPAHHQFVPLKQIDLSERDGGNAQRRTHSRGDTGSKARGKLSGSPMANSGAGAATSSRYGTIAISNHKSPPRSQICNPISRPGFQAMTPQEEEVISLSINGDIL